MRRGTWHQMGDKSQKLVEEQFQKGVGVGAIFSPRDLSLANAAEYTRGYRQLGASVLFDPQFHVPDCSNISLASYPGNEFRQPVTKLNEISDSELAAFSLALEDENRRLNTDAVIAPAVVCEAGRPESQMLNQRLFEAAKQVGNILGRPTYATVFLGRSATSSDESIKPVFSDATAADCDGWYFAFEFERERLPSDEAVVYRCLRATLDLACTGKPVLHAYAGPLGLLSAGAGATGAAIGHSQNLWKFTRERWEETPGPKQRGGGDAPPRFFSTALWGTIVFPDETEQLPAPLRDRVLTMSPFSENLLPGVWSRWVSNKHLIFSLGRTIQLIASAATPRAALSQGIELLGEAISLHNQIKQAGIALSDDTVAYQTAWFSAAVKLRDDGKKDFDYLDLLQ